LSHPTPGRGRRPLVIAVAVGLLAIIGIYVFTARDGAAANRTDCVSLELSSSTEKDDILAAAADTYNRSGREFAGDKCAKVSVHGLTSGAGMEALSKGWTAADTGQPQPQVWAPSTSLWLSRLEARGQSAVAVSSIHPSIMSSPLVVAMPEMMAKVFLEKNPNPGWADILKLATAPGGWGSLGHPEWGEFKLGRDHPELSSSGLGASMATFHAAAVANGFPKIDESNVGNAGVLRFVHDVESSVARYSKDAAEFVDLLAAEDKKNLPVPYVSAVVMQEELAFTYNKRGPIRKFQAIYPKDGALQFDHPYVVLTSATADQRAAADDFFKFISEPETQAVFRATGFRDRGAPNTPTQELRDVLSVPAEQSLPTMPLPEPKLAEEIVKLWNSTRREARVLLVLDISGSMTQEANKSDPELGDTTKITLVKPAAKRALDLLSAKDEVGLWTFSSPGHTEVVPIGKLSDNKAAITQAIDGINPVGGTALYDTVAAAHAKMIQSVDADRINAIVVLSDGQDDSKVPPPAALLAKINPELTERAMPIFTISFGKDADPDAMRLIASTSKALAYDAVKDPKNIDEVFTAVFRNF